MLEPLSGEFEVNVVPEGVVVGYPEDVSLCVKPQPVESVQEYGPLDEEVGKSVVELSQPDVVEKLVSLDPVESELCEVDRVIVTIVSDLEVIVTGPEEVHEVQLSVVLPWPLLWLVVG